MANTSKSGNISQCSSKIAQLYRSVYTSEPLKPLPMSWSPKCRSNDLKIPQFGVSITCVADPPPSRQNPLSDIHIVRADHPIPFTAGIYYFETTLCHFKQNCAVVIGVASKRATKSGNWDASAFGYHSDGSIYNHTTQTTFGPTFGSQDVIGCGVDLITKSLFFTKNGEFLGKAYEGKIPLTHESESRIIDIYPVIALEGQGCRIKANFGEQPFSFPFKRHLLAERVSHENQLIGLLDKEFINIKMRELVGSYLVHHGYIESAKAIARWNSFAEAAPSPKKTRSDVPMEEQEEKAEDEDESAAYLPGYSSMQHRRSLHTFCLRCQYGRVANALTTLYPTVVERYPEIILQLRCRQLVEMMCRHSEHRAGQILSSSDPKFQKQTGISRKRPCATTNASCCGCGTSESVPTLATCDEAEVQSKYFHTDSLRGMVSQAHFQTAGSSAATSYDSMDIDSSLGMEPSASHLAHSQQQQHLTGPPTSIAVSSISADAPTAAVATASSTNDFFDDDFGDSFDDDFGLPTGLKQQKPTMGPIPMDTESACSAPAPTGGSFSLAPPEVPACQSAPSSSLYANSLESGEEGEDERRRLLRQIQFSRSLVDLARKVKSKRGSLSEDTARLVHQSVSLMAYPSPSSPECPLRCLLDSSWREKIANLINSAILTEAHNMPPQPALEQAIYTLQACLADPNCVEAQTLGHFLLYHLPQSEYTAEVNLLRKNVDTSTDTPQTHPPPAESSGGAYEHSLEIPRSSSGICQRRNQEEEDEEEADSLASKSNGTGVNSNGRVSSPKGYIHTSTNGASRRHGRRRRGTRSGTRYALVETLPSTDEEEAEVEADDISMEEGVQLHHHVELEDDQDEVESLEDEAGVELMTATMEDDGFDEEEDEEEEQHNPGGDEEAEEEDDEEEEQSESDGDRDEDVDVEMAMEEDQVERELLRWRRETYAASLTEGRFTPSEASIVASGTGGGSNSGSSSRTRTSSSTTSSSRRSEPFSTYASVVARLPGGYRPRRHPRFLGTSGTGATSVAASSSTRVAPPSRSSRRGGGATTTTNSGSNATNNTNQ